MLTIKNFETGKEISTADAAKPAPKRTRKNPPPARRSNDVVGKRKRWQRDEEVAKQIGLRLACGMPHAIICRLFNLNDQALHLMYQAEIDEGLAIANMNVAAQLYNAAINGNITAMIFWLKSRAGWRDMDSKHEHEHRHQFKTAYDIDKMSEPELLAEIARLRAQDDAAAGRETTPPSRPERPNGMVH